jgi:hypothetical protein
MGTRMSGGVGAGRATLPVTRFAAKALFTQRRKDPKDLIIQAVDGPLNPVFHQVGAKVEEKPKSLPMALSFIFGSWRLGVTLTRLANDPV